MENKVVFISEFNDQDKIRNYFLVRKKSLLTDRNNKPYLSLNLSDKSGQINARIWENVEAIDKEVDVGKVVFIKGHIQTYQNKLQLVVHQLRKAQNEEYDMSHFVKAANQSSEAMFQELQTYIEKIQDSNIQLLVNSVISQPDVKEKLFKYPAARSIHHAYYGGLLEHILSITKVLDQLSKLYPQLNYDYLIFGGIFHDIGKLWELSVEEGVEYTTEGRLLGHIPMASELVEKHTQKILGFPEKLKIELKHMILSHHGRLEYGSPKRPKFLEAFVVAMVDELDSKMNTLTELMTSEIQGSKENSWSSFNRDFDRFFYLDILKKKIEEEN